MRAFRIALWTLLGLLLATLALLGSLWWWSGSDSSLDTSLAQLRRWLPADQTLQTEGVQGSLRAGGRIAALRWQMGPLQVQAQGIEIGWTLGALFDGELQLGRVQIAHLRIDDQRPPSKPQPPASLLLPLKVRAAFGVDTLEWVGPPPFTATQLRGDYAFDGQQHTLQLQDAQWSSGRYQGQARLQATAPMALAAQLQGQLQTQLPSSGKALQVQAQATLEGTLADLTSVLQLKAQLAPAGGARNGMQADVQAQIAPWQAQPIVQAEGRWQALDLAALWPQAPRTLLSGHAKVQPQGDGWHGSVQTRNAAAGPWDKGRLPVESLQSQFLYRNGGWGIEQLQAQGAGGQVTAQGNYQSSQGGGQWQGQARVRNINPAALHTQLATDSLNGDLSARQGAQGIAFDARLQGSKAGTASATLVQLKSLQANGLWRAPQLQLDALKVETSDASLQGKLSWNTQSRATSGQLALTLPGAAARIDGALSATQGQGQASLQVSDATLATRWLARWPGMPQALRAPLQGKAEATLRWNGGWQDRGRQLRVQALARATQLGPLAAAEATRWQLREAQANLDGSLAALKLRASGKTDYGQLRSDWQTEAQGSYGPDGTLHAQIQQLKLGLQHSLRPGNWSAQLAEPVDLRWKAPTFELSAGSASLQGPAPGTARLLWQTTRFENAHQWRTQGMLKGLPLAWLDLLGQQQIANLGLRGNLLFDGQWDAAVDQSLRLRASLIRQSGDLQLQAEDSGDTIAAGLREASLVIEADGEQASARLRWDSESAGQVQADFSTRLQREASGWTWAPDAPLAAKLVAQLPRVGVWSLLAPPGWRLRGTLDANAALSGTRANPQWRGQLEARDLALRSVVDGIDFSQGTLRVQLEGQHLEITEFSLRGAGGAGGGLLTVSGQADWLPATNADSGVARLAMDLNGTADKLRIGTRPDQRLTVSGNLTARLRQTQLQLRGSLRADAALFILPDETAPKLGSDVVVRTNKPAVATRKNGAAAAPASGRRVVPDIQIALDLGPDFQLQGQGLATRLEGTLELRSAADKTLQPRLSGVLRTALGSYRAYGQNLDIEEGTLRFTGAYDNPSLDILAIRPNLQQRVGVQITGTAQSPAVRLYAEPDLPEAEKLAWLVLGRSGAEGGAETAMLQQAALALLAGKNSGGGLAGAFGLDEVSVRGAASSDSATGTGTGASLTLGKRLSRNFYLAYERSLAGTLGTFYIFYDLSRRFTLRAQTGEESAVDLIFTVRYD